ncbi:MAG TPA: hypothetical protein VNH22_19315 [Blastocatellia bacterium]|jgi:hypothetical protein|nr:hypothetical protein [Blastocatellia bacterium]
MARIDRLGWAAGMSFVSYGIRVGVRVNRPEALDRLVEYFPPGWRPASSNRVERLYSLIVGNGGKEAKIRRFNLLYADIAKISRGMELEHVLDAFESDLQLYVAENARRRTFVHAGVVGWKNRAVVIPGRSFSGKTTLVAELVRAGATYYSDEYAVLDSRGRVHPYPRPLAIRSQGEYKSTKHPVEMLGGVPGVRPLQVGLVVVSQYKEGARWRPRQLSKGQGALALLANTVSAREQPETALSTLRHVVSEAPVIKGVRGEASEVVEAIFRSFDQ